MKNFVYQNPVKIYFGPGQIAALEAAIPKNARVFITYGKGSIKENGVYKAVLEALKGHDVVGEFGGIEANPDYATLRHGVSQAQQVQADYLLAVGGGSVLDGTKFMAAAMRTEGDPWDFVVGKTKITGALHFGAVLTLPATGSEMNFFSVVSRREWGAKVGFGHPLLYPQFSILDPSTTATLPLRQVGNGIVDAFVHTTEQYLTVKNDAPLQERFAEGVLSTLIEQGPLVVADNATDSVARANIMWTATMALSGIFGVGVVQDWATHTIGHELTAEYGLDHAQTLAVVLPSLLAVKLNARLEKLAQYGRRVWGLEGTDAVVAKHAIENTRTFFENVGVPTRLSAYGVGPEAVAKISSRLEKAGAFPLGELQDINVGDVRLILEKSL